MCILFVYSLLNVVSHYDLSVLSMSVMGFQKTKLDMGVNGWDELYPVIFGIFKLCQAPYLEAPMHQKFIYQHSSLSCSALLLSNIYHLPCHDDRSIVQNHFIQIKDNHQISAIDYQYLFSYVPCKC